MAIDFKPEAFKLLHGKLLEIEAIAYGIETSMKLLNIDNLERKGIRSIGTGARLQRHNLQIKVGHFFPGLTLAEKGEETSSLRADTKEMIEAHPAFSLALPSAKVEKGKKPKAKALKK